MLLTIDAGNTNTVFALYAADHMDMDAPAVAVFRCRTSTKRTADELAAWFLPLCQHAQIDAYSITDIIISSVVPDGNRWLSLFCQTYLDNTPCYVDHSNVGLQVALERPQQAGADLLVNALAVCKLYQTPAIIVDFGTATTFTAMQADQVYRGGVITPGINLSLDALQRAAARLPKIDLAIPDKVIGSDTISAMQSGLYWGYVAMIEGLVARISAEMGSDPMVIGTGGLAPWFEEATDAIHRTDSHLTMKGLRLVHHALKA